LEEQQASGLPVSVFCRERGIPSSSLFAWRRRLRGSSEVFKAVKLVDSKRRGRAGDGVDAGGDVIAGGAIEPSAAGFVELALAGGRRLIVRRGFDRELLLDLLDALEGCR
jgi:hypothetical protein